MALQYSWIIYIRTEKPTLRAERYMITFCGYDVVLFSFFLVLHPGVELGAVFYAAERNRN